MPPRAALRPRRSLDSKRRPGPPPLVQEALQVTWTLKGHLKNAQISYLRVGVLLARVRDRKLYAALKHPDMESYAAERLGLQRASLYRYLQVLDWVRRSHPEWLEPKPKGRIPDLSDVTALIWIEKRLRMPGLDPEHRAELEALRKKALAGRLTQREYSEFRRRGMTAMGSLRAFLRSLRRIRKRGEKMAAVPEEALAALQEAIDSVLAALERKGKIIQAIDNFAAKIHRQNHRVGKRLRKSLFK